MSKRLVQQIKCDLCERTGTYSIDEPSHGEITTDVRFAFADREVELDLCSDDYAGLLSVLNQYLEIGRPASTSKMATKPKSKPKSVAQPTAESAKPFACPDCDFTSSSSQGLGAHRWRSHGIPGQSKDSVRDRSKRKNS